MPRAPYRMSANFSRELVAFATGPHVRGSNFNSHGMGSSFGEYEIQHGAASSGRAVCLACAERLPPGEPVLVVSWLVGAGFNQWNTRQMHAAACVPITPAGR